MEKTQFDFKAKNDLETRTDQATKMRERCPEKIPVILEKYQGSKEADKGFTVTQTKFLVPSDFTYGKFLAVVRERMQSSNQDSSADSFVQLDHKQSLYIFFADNRLQKMDRSMAEIDDKCKDQDGFLYGAYTSQEVFGSSI